MRQAIVTRFAPATNHNGSRVIVRAQGKRLTVPWDHALGSQENHIAAAEAFRVDRMWVGRLVGGAMPDGSGCCFVLIED